MSHICVTCGTQYPNPNEPPRNCPICEDERQYVGPLGQKWIALPELQKTHRNVFFEEGENLWGIHTEPNFAIGQRALLLQTQYGGTLWDCLSLIDASTFDLVKALGGLSAIAISHPHYYTSMVEWSRAFGGIPIYLHEADREWVQHHDSAIVFWSGEKHSLNDDLTLIRVGGHLRLYAACLYLLLSGRFCTSESPRFSPELKSTDSFGRLARLAYLDQIRRRWYPVRNDKQLARPYFCICRHIKIC